MNAVLLAFVRVGSYVRHNITKQFSNGILSNNSFILGKDVRFPLMKNRKLLYLQYESGKLIQYLSLRNKKKEIS